MDEYDTPMQEAYVDGYWDELVGFTRSMFNSTFKTNPWLERAIMTGITRVSKEPIFSDLNNLKVVTTTSEEYAESFGFTEKEVFEALDEYGWVRAWIDCRSAEQVCDHFEPGKWIWKIRCYAGTQKSAGG